MKPLRILLFLLASVSLMVLIGCQGEGGSYESDSHAAPEPAAADANEAQPAMQAGQHSHSVRCGCSLEEVGECGNFIEVEGQFVELVLPEENDLKEMPFCGQADLVATVEGEMVDGRFVAASFSYTN